MYVCKCVRVGLCNVRLSICVLTPKSKASQIVKHLDVENHFILLLGKRGKFTKDVIYSSIEVYLTKKGTIHK